MLNNRYVVTCLLVASILAIRFFSLGAYPLTDTTEARYGEIARIMAETGDWITPYFDYGVPFWGKPPMTFWLSALSFKALGVSEFSARLPSWLCGLATLLILSRASSLLGIQGRFVAPLILLSTLVFFVVIGGVMTEASLVLGLTLSLVSWIRISLHSENDYSNWLLFFVGLAIGMLAKGPITLVFIGGPLVIWMLVHRQWSALCNIPQILAGVIVFSVLTIPWYLLAELKTPGFLNYFILGEHFYRFITPGWTGDLYGNAHREPYGTIWLFWLLSAFPWSIWFLKFVFVHAKKSYKKTVPRFEFEPIDYLLLYWAFFPQLFFTFAGNILMSYVVPGAPALALLVARIYQRGRSQLVMAGASNDP